MCRRATCAGPVPAQVNAATGQTSWERPQPEFEPITLMQPMHHGYGGGPERPWLPGGLPPPRRDGARLPSSVTDISLDEITLTAEEAEGLSEAQQAALLQRKKREAQRAREVVERQAERLRREQEGLEAEADDYRARRGERHSGERHSGEQALYLPGGRDGRGKAPRADPKGPRGRAAKERDAKEAR